MWNLFVVDDYGEVVRINSRPYSAEQVAWAIAELQLDARLVLLVPHDWPDDLPFLERL